MLSKLKNPISLFSKLSKRCISSDLIHLREDVKSALSDSLPVVALESTIITHGMPFPQNRSTALKVEEIIQSNGAIPATVGIIDGKLIIGLTKDEINFLSDPESKSIKTSRRDLSYVLSKNLCGGTTVSSTMLAAHMVGISVFVTGGIGGVHRNASTSFDISADLTELGQTPVAVVCSGVKSILDIGSTLEYLETQGVPVITYGKSPYFPSFFTPASDFKSPYCMEHISDITKCILTQNNLNLQTGMVIGVPINNKDAQIGRTIDQAIQQALQDAKEDSIAGKDITPYVLSKVSSLSKGASLKANISLIENNATIGAQIAVQLSSLKQQQQQQQKHQGSNLKYATSSPIQVKEEIKSPNASHNVPKRPVIIGGSVFDIKATADSVDVIAEATNPGKVDISFGGVARNVTECLARLDCDPLLISAIGKDSAGEMLLDGMSKLHMDTSGLIFSHHATASYSIVANNVGDILLAVGDMDIHQMITPAQILQQEENIKNCSIVIVDSNISEESISETISLCTKHNIPIWFEPTCVNKATKPFLINASNRLTYASPNAFELNEIHMILNQTQEHKLLLHNDELKNISRDRLLHECEHMGKTCLHSVDNLLVTLGRYGVLHLTNDSAVHYPPCMQELLPVDVKSVSGAGDSFVGGMVFGILHGYTTESCIKAGLKAAYTSLQTYNAISDKLNKDEFTLEKIQNWAPFNGRLL